MLWIWQKVTLLALKKSMILMDTRFVYSYSQGTRFFDCGHHLAEYKEFLPYGNCVFKFRVIRLKYIIIYLQ